MIALKLENTWEMTIVNRTNMSAVIEVAIEQKLDRGMKDKQKIFSEIVVELGVPRPTVRRVARDLRNKYLDKVRILQSDYTTRIGEG